MPASNDEFGMVDVEVTGLPEDESIFFQTAWYQLAGENSRWYRQTFELLSLPFLPEVAGQ